MTKEERALDKKIGLAWHRLASDITIAVLDAPRIVRDIKLEVAGGATMDEAINMMIERYRVN